MDEIKKIALDFIGLKNSKILIEKQLKEARKKLLNILDSKDKDLLIVEDIKIGREVRKHFYLTPENREKYGKPQNVVYLLVNYN